MERELELSSVETICVMWTFENWLWIFTLALQWRYWSLTLLSNEERAQTNCYIALAPTLLFSGWFWSAEIITSVAVLVASAKEESFWKYGCALHKLRNLCKYLVGKTKGTTDASWHHLHVVYIIALYSSGYVPGQTIYIVKLLDCLS